MNELLYKDEVYAIQGAIFEVYKEMGNAWHEDTTKLSSNSRLLTR